MKKQELILKVLEKCYFISTHSKCDVFFRYAPHVNSYDVDYYFEGWDIAKENISIDICTKVNCENLMSTLKELEILWQSIEENNLSN